MVGGFLADDSGAAHPSEKSFGVIREGGLPMSMAGRLGLAGAGSGVAQVLSFPEDHGSNKVELG